MEQIKILGLVPGLLVLTMLTETELKFKEEQESSLAAGNNVFFFFSFD